MTHGEKCKHTASLPWDKIARDYIAGKCTVKDICEKYHVSTRTVERKSTEGGWMQKRKTLAEKTADSQLQAMIARGASRAEKIQTAADILLDQIITGLNNGKILVSVRSLRDITGALKDLQEISGLKEEEKVQEIYVKIGGGLEDYAD